MKKNIKVYYNGEYIDKEINYIPTRYIIAMLITIIHVALLILAVLLAKKLRKKLDNNSKLPSIILLILGLYKIFI